MLLLRTAQVVLAALIIAAAVRTLRGQWGQVREVASGIAPDWPLLVLASGLVIATYLLLVATWRHVVNGMGGALRPADAAYIWFVSALARYLGALWQVVALGALSQRRGAPPMVAAGAAVVMTIVNILTGFGVALATGGLAAGTLDARAYAAIFAGAAALLLAPMLAPRLSRVASRVSGRDVQVPRVTARAIWAAALGSTVSWFTYGFAFYLLTHAVLGYAPGSWLAYVAVYTTAYLAGLLGLVPAGIGVAEAAMVFAFAAGNLLTGPEAVLVAVVSRLWRTVLEILPGAALLAFRGRPAPGAREPS